MDCTYVDSAIKQLSKLLMESHLTYSWEKQIKALLQELRFVELFFSFAKLKTGPLLSTAAEAKLEEAGKGLYDAGYFAMKGIDVQDWEHLASNLRETVDHFKPEIGRICIDMVHRRPLQGKFSTLEFMDSILLNLRRLSTLKGDNIVNIVEQQIVILEEKLRFSRNFVDFITRFCTGHDKLGDFSRLFHVWATNAACLSLLYWVDGMDEKKAPEMNSMLSDMLQKIMPYDPEVTEMYLELLKASKPSKSDTLLMGQILVGFVDNFLETLVGSSMNEIETLAINDIEILREGLTFFIAFLMDPPEELGRQTENPLLNQIEEVLSEMRSLISLGPNTSLRDFLEKITKVEKEVGDLYVNLPNSSDSNCPKTNGKGFLDFLLINLAELMESNPDFVLFAKQKIVKIHMELESLILLLEDRVEMQNEYEFEDLWKQTFNVAYRAQQVINSCSIVDTPIWHHIICLSDVLNEIQTIKEKVVEIKNDQTRSNRRIYAETNSRGNQTSPISTSRADQETVGLDDEATSRTDQEPVGLDDEATSRTDQEPVGLEDQAPRRTDQESVDLEDEATSRTDQKPVGLKGKAAAIIDQLTRGSAKLSIVSIVGTSGVGKTTLAKKVYEDPNVARHFHKIAWCSVSQIYRSCRDLLLDILRCIASLENVDIYNVKEEELAALVWRSLSGPRYLIVMDDIWDAKAWNDITFSLPDNNSGSRILLTSQVGNLDLHHNYSDYPLSPLTDEETWEFLKEMIFAKDGCPEHLSDVGKKIAGKCGGLPLAIAATADLLRREKENLDYWNQIEETLNLGTVSEGYKNILQLRYKHLPDYLKPCFLYFGSFQVGKEISAQKLTLLWIGEGFIRGTEKKSSEVVAKEYLMELINRSLVVVTKKSSNGGIKACRIHDLLHYFCVDKAKEEKFIQVDWHDCSHGSSTLVKHDTYRLCILTKWKSFIQSEHSGLHVYSLLVCFEIRRNQSQSSSAASNFLHSFKLLKVLNLESIYLHVAFPEEIMQIVHLRYLALQGGITKVPSSIANLWNLRTFVVKGSSESSICLPETIWRMKSLKHVHVSENALIFLGDYELEELVQLNEINTFSTLALHGAPHLQKLLRRLTGLQKLGCVISESQLYGRNNIQFPGFASLQNLKSLALSISGSQGRTSYSRLHIQFQIFSFPSTLKKLTLYKLGLPWRAMSKIRQLLNLEVLKLREHAFQGKLWDMDDEQKEFDKLKVLELSDLNIERWIVETDPFPILQQLVIRDCYRLEEIPSYFRSAGALEMIDLHRCSDSAIDSAERIEEEQKQYNDKFELRCIRNKSFFGEELASVST